MDDLELDRLALRWQDALDVAAETLDELSCSRLALHLSVTELRSRASELQRERDAAELDLERLATTTHTRLRRHLRGRAG